MAKRKYEFRPDKTQAGLLNKLYLTPKQRISILRWFLYTLLLIVLSVVQDVFLCRANFFGATTDLVPCAIILICVELGAEQGSIFSLIAALLYMFSGTAPGYYVIGLIPVIGITAAEITDIHFRVLSQREIRSYVATGEPMDKAGAYGIQGGAALFAEKMQGDYYNVMGLPVCRLFLMLRTLAPELMEDMR